MPRGIRKTKSLTTVTEKLIAIDQKIDDLSKELRGAKLEKKQLLKDKSQCDEQNILQAIKDSTKTKEEIMAAIKGE